MHTNSLRHGKPEPAAAPQSVLVGRQPIFDSRRRVYGYELLFQHVDPLGAADSSGDDVAAKNITDAVIAVGLDKLAHGRRAFITVPLSFLKHDLAKALPSNRIVLQVPCDREIDAAVVDACRELRAKGYVLALDKFTPTEQSVVLLSMAEFLKIDLPSMSPQLARECVAVGRRQKAIATIAARVETAKGFDDAVREGFSHAQGLFFERPTTVRSGALPEGKVSSLRLLCALNDPDLSVNTLDDLIKHDGALCYRILRTVNSAAFAQSRQVTSMRHALLLLGLDTIRRWASLWVMAGLGAAAGNELVLTASVRGRFCEIISIEVDGPDAGGEGFLLGMCSLLDVILQKPMAEVVADLPLSTATADALLGRRNPLRDRLDCIIAYDRADWSTCLPLIDAARVKCATLPRAYREAVRWADDLARR
jgi:c-di-GMP-related signal transduction protein